MTTIKATCPTCGEVDLTAEDIELRISSTEDGSEYGFECPMCVSLVWKPADARIIQLLISGGVRASVRDEELTRSDAPAFTYDDLLDFHFALESESILEDFLNPA